ncbi:ACP S-malonyltransferase, partial [candidate division KSB1 bacterium]|nr:ACP S-malonyltransferase [candidate division KSB1 bacterium]NIR69852.1 ACP S-malonyltransferase [candidate division KSB1 bacterium]NIS22972.1 ACP S-malonyltransferase [candidate division KSB1 bacterium]NIT69829.1 ACP S-malonyltransferase [candidate division KSB1 bacterium]NIU25751.1 ACP S-malonyltransferase [candidate division KSB1 bacterium]
MTRNSRAEVQKFVSSLSKKLENIESLDLAQLAYCLFLDEQRHNEKHKPDACRLDIVAMSLDDLKNKLKKTAHGLSTPNELNTLPGIFYSENPKPSGKLCFLFPGQGSQRVNMLRDLAIGFPDTQSHIEHADDLLKRYFDKPLSGIIYPLPVFSEGERSTQQKQLNATQVAQPAMGLVDLVAFDILACFGLQPEFVAGHSYGEYVALSAAGAISRDDLLRLSAIRGQIVYQSSKNHPGTMAAVQVSADKTSAVIDEARLSVWLANLNAPNQTIIAGEQNAIAKAVQ